MAIDFPSSPTDNLTWTDPESGTEWTYDATNNSWTLTGSGTPGGSAFNYRGEHNFTQATLPDPVAEAGFVYSQSDLSGATGTVNNVYNGIAGDRIEEGDLVLYTGSSWTFLTNVPGYPNLGDGNGDTLDARYVRTQPDGNASQNVSGDLTIGGTNKITLDASSGRGEFSGGVKVSGGSPAAVEMGMYAKSVINNRLAFASDSVETLMIEPGRTACGEGVFPSNNSVLTVGGPLTESISQAIRFTPKFESTVDEAAILRGFHEFKDGTYTVDKTLGLEIISPQKGVNVTLTNFKAFSAGELKDAADTVYGFYSKVGSSSNVTYNFYAAGTAPNYFAGQVLQKDTPNPPAGGLLTQPWLWDTESDDSNAIVMFNGGFNSVRYNTQPSAAGMTVNRIGSPTGALINWYENGKWVSDIRLNNGDIIYGGQSDYRLKQNVLPLSSVTEAVKNLNPITFQYTNHPNYTHNGFLAHELQAIVPSAVSGTKDETEVVGTLLDWDGTELETDVVEPENLTYEEQVETDGVTQMVTRTRSWNATGTRPVYQSVDQTKLIPLLTKALQEALERIEALENAAAY